MRWQVGSLQKNSSVITRN